MKTPGSGHYCRSSKRPSAKWRSIIACSHSVLQRTLAKSTVAKLQRIQFGKSSEKLREKTARQVREAEERISALQEEMAEVLGEQHDPVLPPPLRQSSSRKPLPASLPRETRRLLPAETACPACDGELCALGGDVSELLELISSAFKVIETQRPKLACCSCDHIVQAPVPSKPLERSYAGPGLLARIVKAKFAEHTPHYRQSEIYRRHGVELSRATLGLFRCDQGAAGAFVRPAAPVRSDAGQGAYRRSPCAGAGAG